MNSIKDRLLTNWHVMRILRLAIGIWMLAVGIQTKDWAIGLLSTFFLYQAIMDVGCCGTQGCYTPTSNTKTEDKTTEAIEFEEIK